jgi:hypothetical protein
MGIGFVVERDKNCIAQDRFVKLQGIFLPFKRKSEFSISYVSLFGSFIRWEDSVIFWIIDINDVPFDLSLKTVLKIDRKVIQAFKMDFIGLLQRGIRGGLKKAVSLFSK